MKLFNMRGSVLCAMVALLLLAAGCSETRINFDGPPGSVMFVDDKPYHLPADVKLIRPGAAGESNRHRVALVFTTAQATEAKAQGYIDVYGYVESDIDKIATVTCKMDETELTKMLNGATLIYKGSTASRQPLYELTLLKK